MGACLAGATIIMAPAASAQTAPGRVVGGVSGGVQRSAPAGADRFEFESNVETATVDVVYPATSAVLVDVSLGVRVWKGIGAGLAVSHATRSGSAQVDARVPHPLLFEQPRAVEGSQARINRTETAVHVQLLYAIEATRTVTLVLSGGPSVVHLEQDLVTEVKYDESYPFDVATFTRAAARRAKASAAGFNAGADVRWMFARSIGVGALVRFSRATVDLNTVESRTLPVRAGGVQAGVGMRVVF